MDIFVGHVGGDDFVVVCHADHAATIAENIVEKFGRETAGLYDQEDRDRGFIEVVNRRGETQRFPFLSLSIGIATSAHRKFEHYAQAVAIATEMKTFTKGTPGSSWAVDRRTS